MYTCSIICQNIIDGKILNICCWPSVTCIFTEFIMGIFSILRQKVLKTENYWGCTFHDHYIALSGRVILTPIKGGGGWQCSPGHKNVLQSLLSWSLPTQCAPPARGAGSLHSLDLVCSPPPHSELQSVQSSHILHTPSIGRSVEQKRSDLKVVGRLDSLSKHFVLTMQCHECATWTMSTVVRSAAMYILWFSEA